MSKNGISDVMSPLPMLCKSALCIMVDRGDQLLRGLWPGTVHGPYSLDSEVLELILKT